MSPVVEHVGERAASLPGCPDLGGVVPVCEDLAAAAVGAVDGASGVDGEALHAPREHEAIGCFDEQVKVVVLDGNVDDPEIAVPQISAEHCANGAVHDAMTQASHTLHGPQDDMDGVAAGELRARPVWRVVSPERRHLPPRTLAFAAMSRPHRVAHLDLGSNTAGRRCQGIFATVEANAIAGPFRDQGIYAGNARGSSILGNVVKAASPDRATGRASAAGPRPRRHGRPRSSRPGRCRPPLSMTIRSASRSPDPRCRPAGAPPVTAPTPRYVAAPAPPDRAARGNAASPGTPPPPRAARARR